jgi:hypothetical protein
VTVRRWHLAASAIGLIALAVVAVVRWRGPDLGALEARPATANLSVRVGERLDFAASAPGATETVWSMWGHAVATGPTWSYVPASQDAGWQQVTAEVRGRRGGRIVRTWDVGVVSAVVPEIASLDPPAGPLALAAGARPTFHAKARVTAARTSDRLAYEWTIDDRPLLRDEQPADDGASEIMLPPLEPGSHRLRLRVTEDGRSASVADWAIESATREATATAELVGPELPSPLVGPELPPTPPTALAREEPVASPEPPPSRPAPPALVPMAGARLLDGRIGEPLALDARVDTDAASVSRRWSVDGHPTTGGPRLEWTPRQAGRHRIAVTVALGRRVIGRDAWTVEVRPVETTPPVVTAAVPPPTPVAAVPPPPAPTDLAPLEVVRVPEEVELDADVDATIPLEARVATAPAALVYRWQVDGRPVRGGQNGRLGFVPTRAGRHTVAVVLEVDGRPRGRASWVVRAEKAPAAPAPTELVTATAVSVPAPVPTLHREAPAPSTIEEGDVRRWLAEYARAWSRKDVDALRRMGQVRSPGEAAQLERYFHSIGALDVDVNLLSLTPEGTRASIEFERTDTVTDPGGRRQQLHLPPIHKRIERTPDGLRFAEGAGAG